MADRKLTRRTTARANAGYAHGQGQSIDSGFSEDTDDPASNSLRQSGNISLLFWRHRQPEITKPTRRQASGFRATSTEEQEADLREDGFDHSKGYTVCGKPVYLDVWVLRLRSVFGTGVLSAFRLITP